MSSADLICDLPVDFAAVKRDKNLLLYLQSIMSKRFTYNNSEYLRIASSRVRHKIANMGKSYDNTVRRWGYHIIF